MSSLEVEERLSFNRAMGRHAVCRRGGVVRRGTRPARAQHVSNHRGGRALRDQTRGAHDRESRVRPGHRRQPGCLSEAWLRMVSRRSTGLPRWSEKRKGRSSGENRPIVIGRDDRIRTRDPLTPSQVRYQAALHPECCVRCSAGCAPLLGARATLALARGLGRRLHCSGLREDLARPGGAARLGAAVPGGTGPPAARDAGAGVLPLRCGITRTAAGPTGPGAGRSPGRRPPPRRVPGALDSSCRIDAQAVAHVGDPRPRVRGERVEHLRDFLIGLGRRPGRVSSSRRRAPASVRPAEHQLLDAQHLIDVGLPVEPRAVVATSARRCRETPSPTSAARTAAPARSRRLPAA